MANTTNFNWETPDDTDLVKDGAAAMRTLGNSIDTSFVDLKGGTTGQILSKASNADLDYTWVTTDDANAIQNAIVDAKGDLIAASANDTPARLAVGNNGETLVADSSTSTGLRYTAGNPISNPVLNSAFQIWQRGTSFTAAGLTADRWQTGSTAGKTISRQLTGDTTNLPNIQYCVRMQRNSGTTGTGGIDLGQNFETVNSIPFAGKTVTMSFYARAGANYSPTSSILVAYLFSGTGTDQNVFTGLTGSATVIGQSATLTTTWQRFSYTGTVGSTATQIVPYFIMNPTGTAGANDYADITGVQIDIGSVALPFRTFSATIQGELSACQRYYWRSAGGSTYTVSGFGWCNSTTTAYIGVNLPVAMRAAPASVDFSAQNLNDAAANYAVTAILLESTWKATSMVMLVPTVASGLTLNRPIALTNNNNAAGYVGLSAEL